MGTPVLATETGSVISVATVDADDCGISINVAADSGVTFRYCHLSAITVMSGPVTPGMPIGLSGQTGNAKAPHLHFGYLDAPNVKGIGTLAMKSIKVNAYIDSVCK